MNFRILGSASGYPELNKHHSAYLINFEDKNVLLDAGDGVSSRLLKFGLIKNEIDYIIISHYHPDHISGIFMVLQMLYLQKRDKKLVIYLPERIEEFIKIIDYFYSFPKRFTYEIEFKNVTELIENFKGIIPIESDHLLSYKEFVAENELDNTLKAYSFLFKNKESSLIISCDIAGINHIGKYQHEVGNYVIDAFHPSAEEIVDFHKNYNGKIILSHGLSLDLLQIIEKSTENYKIADEEKIYYC